ncbi:MAG: cytochrome ubiquinol oxidase subunit I, partial [Anaerobacillus sp.]
TSVKGKKAGNDPWDGRTLEWAISSPAPEYNFAQTPLVRGLDAWWLEKRAGNKEMVAAEPLDDIHMPDSSILPVLLALGLFTAALSAIYSNWALAIGGLALAALSMILRSVVDYHGYHIHKEDLPSEGGEGK